NPEENAVIPNFYLQPNGVFYITKEETAGICKTNAYSNVLNVKFATQSGPMLVVDGEINKIFDPNSHNFNIRNGVGILPNNELIFAISINKVSFYDFARYFKEQGCSNALFLDGYISKAYMPKQGIEQIDGELGVLIGITEK
ncbi:MAG: phosphodiester glycosidase family protein, partial [Candidatus Methylopumilus sp.]